ncbi:prolipoprotein diacylglyceryl transferase [Mycobacterium sp. M1]|uniref:Phosphatidylglycerol--prolipoprotein diacylglyceryl transferase n=1 Tax=Mycolicibacter acidiphilus TaxID=2835306 RepID=A0ABS5RIZ8_9MYCO|nr:prolipoprotein diacylglyceryl transferase [Mycolicibacter acidiphilus]MBS9534273.1 prolipoprotein diacylglyceryl transferase [Mycolicibacter acidiphilus]
MTLDWLTFFPSPARGVWHLGPIPIRAYALCIIVGIIAALLIGDRRWQARGGEPGVIYDIALWAVPFGLIGGRLYHLATDWRTYFGESGVGWQATPRIWDGGLGIWGAVALGAVGAWIGCRRKGIPLPAFGDAVAPGVILAQAIGRIGNYFNQELYGRETGLPWGLEIFWREDASGMRDPHLLDGVSTGEIYKIVQPTFLYELLWNLLVFALLLYADRRFRMGHGRLFALYIAAYCIGRFGIELLRDDTATHISGIRVNSFTSTFVFIGAVVYILLATKGREDPEALRRAWQPDETPEAPPEAEPEPAKEPEREMVAVGAGMIASIAAADVAGDAGDAASGGGEPGDDSSEDDAAAESDASAEDAATDADETDGDSAGDEDAVVEDDADASDAVEGEAVEEDADEADADEEDATEEDVDADEDAVESDEVETASGEADDNAVDSAEEDADGVTAADAVEDDTVEEDSDETVADEVETASGEADDDAVDSAEEDADDVPEADAAEDDTAEAVADGDVADDTVDSVEDDAVGTEAVEDDTVEDDTDEEDSDEAVTDAAEADDDADDSEAVEGDTVENDATDDTDAPSEDAVAESS